MLPKSLVDTSITLNLHLIYAPIFIFDNLIFFHIYFILTDYDDSLYRRGY